MKIQSLKHKLVMMLKLARYGTRGEPYKLGKITLRYRPGTRPVKLKYVDSNNDNSRYDALQVKLLSERLKEGNFALDIGAHAGQYALIMGALCGAKGRVVAFEPDPYAREKFNNNLALNPMIQCVQLEEVALSDKSGHSVLYSLGGNSQSSFAKTGIGEKVVEVSEQITVKTLTLDDYMTENDLPMPSWVKIDTEGAEIRILSGATRVLASDANIICELHPYAWEELGNSFQELLELVTKFGRTIRYLDEREELHSGPKYGCVLLERKDR